MEIYNLDRSQTEQLLDRIHGWRSGICPDGKLAKTPSFVLSQIPNIVVHPDLQHLFTTDIITEYEWAENLIHCGAINHLDDGIMMGTLADFYMLFHKQTDKLSRSNTVHSIQLRKHASFRVDQIFRPTMSLQKELDSLLEKTALPDQWSHLMRIWDKFGYLWPRRIIIGYKTHVKDAYSFKDEAESIHAYYHHINVVKGILQDTPKLPPFDLAQFLNEGTIVSRLDLAPLHAFLDTKTKNAIQTIINDTFVRIPVYHPIKIYNVSTNSYLCWDPKKKPQPDKIFKGETLDYIVRAVSADIADLSKSPESQYLWRFAWFPEAESNEPLGRHSETIRGGDKVYIYPACRTPVYDQHRSFSPPSHHWKIHDRVKDASKNVDTYKMVLSCCPHRYESEPPSLSKLKGLRLLSSQSPYYPDEKIDWSVEHPNSQLKYMSETAMNVKLNIHEHLRRISPILEGSEVHLQQIGLLTAFVPEASFRSEDLPVQNHRTVKKITPAKSKSSKSNVLCVDEDITSRRFAPNTLWRIELANRFDMDRHASHFFRWPQANNDKQLGYPLDYHPMLSQDVSDHFSAFLNKETGSLISMPTTTSSLRKSKSLGSLQDNNKPKFNTSPSSDKMHYYEDLVNTKGTSKTISQFVKKVSLQPLTQLLKPSRNKQSPFAHNTGK